MNEVTNFMYYCFNRWSLDEACAIFGNDHGNHIWEKWTGKFDSLIWYSELDDDCKQKLVDRANEIYRMN